MTGRTRTPAPIVRLLCGAAAGLILTWGAAQPAGALPQAAIAMSGQAATPVYPAPATRPVFIQPLRLEVGAGRNRNFGRIVFHWPVHTEYQVRKSGETVNIQFNRQAVTSVTTLRGDLPDHIVAAAAQAAPGGLRVALLIQPGTRIRHFREGTNIILDVLRDPPRPRVDTARPAKKKPKKKIVRKNPKPKEPLTVAEVADLAGQNAPVKVVSVPRKKRRSTGGLVSVDVTGNPSSISVRFNWRRNVATAIYRRGANVWIFFDRSARIDLGGIRYLGRKMVRSAKLYQFKNSVLIRLEIPPEIHVRSTRVDNVWSIGISTKPAGGKAGGTFIPVQTEIDSKSRARVVLPVGGARRHYRLRDPEAGDILDIVPVRKPGQGIRDKRRFVEFELFQSIQGVAIRPIAESLAVHAGDEKIIIYVPRGLTVSGAHDIARKKAPSGGGHILDNIRGWRRGPVGDFEEIKARLLEAVIRQPPRARKKARINLAKFYLSHRMAAEASGVLQTIARGDESAKLHPDFRALRGAANYLLAHYAEAAADFVDPQLREERNVWPWLAGLAAARGDWRTAYNLFRGTEPTLAEHPDWLALHFRSLYMEAALTVGDVKQAKLLQRAIARGRGTDEQKSFAEFLRGFLLKKDGKTDEAIAVWSKLVKGPHRRARARATFAMINARLETRKIDTREAIEALEGLGFVWRGGSFEFDLLHRLGDLYRETKDYRNAMLRYRKAATYFKKVRGTQEVTRKLRDTFRMLYLEGGAEKISPVTALALFEEFRELTPPGADGDEMYRRLADRLAAIDLLSEAGELLQKQVEFRLKGALKSRVAARLALIRLLDRRPKDALAALDASAEPDLPAALVRQRRMLRARALAELGRNDEAVAALADENDSEARELKLAILWRGAKWEAANTLARDILGGDKVAAGDDAKTRLVMQRAVAMAMTGNEDGLAGLRHRYGAAMAKSKRAASFRAITEKSRDKVPDFKALARQAGDLDSYRNFLASYRKQVQAAALSKIN